MITQQTAIPARTLNEQDLSHDSMSAYDNLYSRNDYGTLDYPVNARYLDLHKSYLNWIRWHWHEEMEILIVDKGVAEVSTDDDTYLIRPGQGLIINQNVMHCIHAQDKSSAPSTPLSFIRTTSSGTRAITCRRSTCCLCRTTSFLKSFFWMRVRRGMSGCCRH